MPTAHGRSADGAVPDGDWLLGALHASSDMVLVLGPDTTVEWCNPAVHRELGHPPADVLGRSIGEFLHPDDLARAADVLALAASGTFSPSSPITAALYRARRADGSWMEMDINASVVDGDDRLLVVARAGGDLVLGDRLLEAVTGGEPFERQVELVLGLGVWRHPTDGYAVYYTDHDSRRRSVTANLPPELHDVTYPGELSPCQRSWGHEPALVELGPRLRDAAHRRGFVDCLASDVDDPAHPEGAQIQIWTTKGGPTASGHHYDMANMRRALALVLQQRAQVELLERAAHVDEVTGLTSRTRFLDLLDEVEAEAGSAGFSRSILYVDLDGFKQINDALGHVRGDHVLREAAQRLAASVPAEAVVARLGGDEFVVLCPERVDGEGAVRLAQRVVEAMAEPVSVDGVSVHAGASVGVATGADAGTALGVLDAADRALLAAKGQGRGRWVRIAPG